MSVKQAYIKDENNEIISPIVSIDSIYTDGGGSLLDFFYPIGTYYETSDANFNPNTAWGGEWIEDTKGRVLVSRSDDGQFKTVNQVMGSETNTLTINNLPSHSHGYFRTSDSTGSTTLTVDQIPSNSHLIVRTGSVSGGGYGSLYGDSKSGDAGFSTNKTGGSQGHAHSITNTWASTGSTGGSEVVNNVQPSKVCIRWHRIS